MNVKLLTLKAAMKTLIIVIKKTPKTTQLFIRIACSSFSWRRSKRPLKIKNIPTMIYNKQKNQIFFLYLLLYNIKQLNVDTISAIYRHYVPRYIEEDYV